MPTQALSTGAQTATWTCATSVPVLTPCSQECPQQQARPTCRPRLLSCASAARPSVTAPRMRAAVSGRFSCSSELFTSVPVARPPVSPGQEIKIVT
jgi:hypothetical protein